MLIAIGVVLLLAWSVLFLVLHVAAAGGVHLLLIVALVAFGIRLFTPGRRAF